MKKANLVVVVPSALIGCPLKSILRVLPGTSCNSVSPLLFSISQCLFPGKSNVFLMVVLIIKV